MFVIGCNQKDNPKRRGSQVFIDGKEVDINPINIPDSVIIKPDNSYLHNKKIKSLAGVGIVHVIKKPISVIENIFNDYVQYKESIDSEEDKRTITSALNQLDSNLTINDLIVVINVWLYYDPTDFPTRELTENVISRNIRNGILAVKQRKKNKMKWEKEGEAPYSELDYLSKKLKKNSVQHHLYPILKTQQTETPLPIKRSRQERDVFGK